MVRYTSQSSVLTTSPRLRRPGTTNGLIDIFEYKNLIKLISVSVCLFISVQTYGFKLGLENISDDLLRQLGLKKPGAAVGLITNQTGVDQQGVSNITWLQKKGITIAAILTPEHGFNGTIQASKHVSNAVDEKTKIPIISLYGHGTGKSCDVSVLQTITVLFFDMQDVGMRHFTFISTLLKMMECASNYNKPLVVLDRPNPLGGFVEGPLVEPGLHSFISIASIPLRHGLTIGEVARYFNAHVLKKPIALHVIPMHEYNRTMSLAIARALSPNIPTMTSICGYSFLGLLGEVRPCDVGVGTATPFQVFGLPTNIAVSDVAWQSLQKKFELYGIKSSQHKYVSKRKKKSYKGLRLHFTTMHNIPAFELFLTVLAFLKDHHVPYSFSQEFNKAVGTSLIPMVISGKHSLPLFKKKIHDDLQQFMHKAGKILLYQPALVIL